MARKLIDQEEAARILGVPVDDLKAMRDRRELSAYRDGNTWKFKIEDVERLANDRAAEGSGPSWTQPDDNILLSERELGASGETTSSTIIGKGGTAAPDPGGSDLQLTSDLSLGSDVKLVPGGSSSNILGGSSPSKKPTGGLSDLDLSLDLDDTPAGKSSGLSDIELSLDDDLAVGGSGSKKGSGSSLDLDNDDDLVLGTGSDITVSAADSGISLDRPSDSGISLDRPPELGGSNIELLELGEADVISLEEDADLDSATQLGAQSAESDFVLTPDDEELGGDDSGSQVIALDTDESLGSVADMFQGSTPGMSNMLADAGGSGPSILATSAGLSTMGDVVTVPATPEAPFSVWNIVGLSCCAVLLILGGLLVSDLMRNMWSWNQPAEITSGLLTSLGQTFGWIKK